MDFENCRQLTVVGLYDTGPRFTTLDMAVTTTHEERVTSYPFAKLSFNDAMMPLPGVGLTVRRDLVCKLTSLPEGLNDRCITLNLPLQRG